jgi:phenylpropionate dioxygenase-like ring-hydroxylating dioxygenase large terminal subunit
LTSYNLVNTILSIINDHATVGTASLPLKREIVADMSISDDETFKPQNYKGYATSTRAEPEPELTRVGPGTPCGEYMRRFWQPIALTQQVTDVPLRIRILGEDLALFCDGSGRWGLLHLHCSHRNTSLEYGVVEKIGIRCCYHGWHYDIDGRILETPGEPEDSKIREQVWHGAYPVIEYKGLVFAYMGPPEHLPAFPYYDTTMLPDIELVPYVINYPCNWLQICENTMDPYHTVFLHARLTDVHFGSTWGVMPVTDFYDRPEDSAHKVMSTSTYRIDDMIWVRSQETVFPSFSQVGAWWEEGAEEKYFKRASITKWTVPHDDEHCMIIAWRSFGDAFDPKGAGDREKCGVQMVDFEGQTGVKPYEHRQRHPNDYEAQVSIGPIARHANEHLGRTDGGVAVLRRNLRNGIRMLQEGKTLPQASGKDGEWPTHVQDTVLPIPQRPDVDDEQLMREVTKAVMDVVYAGDEYSGTERVAFIESELKKIKHDPRFIGTPTKPI